MFSRDEEILQAAEDWRRAGKGVALATVMETWGSAPRPVGANLVIDDTGNFLGSVSGGCVEGDVIVEALDVISSGLPKMLEFGVADETAWKAGLSCGGVFATPTTPISPTGLCPASQYSSSLVKIPAAGTENDDHNPPRIAPRNLFDIAVGEDNLFNGDKHKWSLRVSVINLTNKEALYNFLSTFSGTHYVTPCTVTAELAFHF